MLENLLLWWANWIATMKEKFYVDFIVDDRWRFLWNGLLITLEVALFAVIIGVVLGFLVAIIRSSYDKTVKSGQVVTGRRKFTRGLFAFVNWLCKVYLTVIRGTPVVVQLLIIYFVIFASVNIDKALAAVIAFGFNSGAYVAEIVRAGIMSIDEGQMEAGRSLGFNYIQSMWYIIIPQAFKNILPALGNEFIVLLKETSVSGYIALADLTKGGDIIRGRTFDAFLPLIAVALIYLTLVMFLTWIVGRVERRLRNSDH